MFEAELDRARTAFEDADGVVAAWVFDLAHAGRVRPASDLDIAVLLAAPPSLDQRAELSAAVQGALGLEEIELNGSSPIVAFEALSGRPLFCRTEIARAGCFADGAGI